MDPRQLLSRLTQLKAEGDQIMQQLVASGMAPEQIMAAVEGGGQQPQIPQPGMGGPGMGAGPGPDLPPGIPQGGPPMGMPQGLLGPM
jgi:hypothetical protein